MAGRPRALEASQGEYNDRRESRKEETRGASAESRPAPKLPRPSAEDGRGPRAQSEEAVRTEEDRIGQAAVRPAQRAMDTSYSLSKSVLEQK